MKKLLAIFLVLGSLSIIRTNAQTPTYQNLVFVSSAPSGVCTNGVPVQVVVSTGFLYSCQSSTWAQIGSTTGTGFPITIGSTSVGSGSTTTTIAGLTLTTAAVNGTLGATTPAAATVTTLTANTSFTLNGGTAQTGTQGTDTKLLTAGTISGTSVLLCTDANGGATTVSCPSGGSGLTVGTTTITSGVSNGLLYDNAGVLGNLATANNGVLVTSGIGAPSISTTLPSSLTIPSPTFSGTVAGANTIPLSILTQISATSLLGNSTGGLANVTSAYVVGNSGSDIPQLTSGLLSPSVIPLATSLAVGGVQGDGSTLTITAGVISCTTSTASQLGCVKPDNSTIVISGGVISSTALVNPMTTLGDTLYGGTSGVATRLAGPTAGAATYVLTDVTSGATAVAPTWTNLATYLSSPPAIGGTSPNTGAFTTLTASTSFGVGASPPTCGVGATGCVALSEAVTAGTPVAGVDYLRASSSTHQLLASLNGGAEFVSMANFSTANLASTSAGGISGTLGIGNGGTGATTAGNALINLFPVATRAGDIIYCATYSGTCTSWGLLAGNNSGTNFLEENASGVPSWAAGGGGDSITSPNATLSVGGTSSATTLDVVGSAGKIIAGSTPALTATPALGTDASLSGTLQLSNGSVGGAHTILGSAATTSNTVNFFTTAPATGDLVDCTTAATVCTLTDAGILAANVTQTTTTPAANQIAVYGSTSKTLTPTTTLPTAAMPALTGDVTNSAGSLSTTVGKINGGTVGNNWAFPVTNGSGQIVQGIGGIMFSIGDPANSSALATTQFALVTVPRACTISGYDLAIDAGTITVKFMKVATGTAIPTIGSNSISTSGVSIASGTAIHSTTTSDFTTTTISAFDIVGVQVTTVATAKALWVTLECK